MAFYGLDLGTKTIVFARLGEDGRPVFRWEINGFYAFDRPDNFVRSILTKQNVPHIEKEGKIYALGRKAEDIAYAFNGQLRRPMANGTVSKEPEAINIMASIIHALIGKVTEDSVICYCIPADALNRDTNVKLHEKIAQMIIEGKKSEAKITAFSVNEARAIAIGAQQDVAIAISWGAGMVNVCYYKWGLSIFEFSLVGSGDWIDIKSAEAFDYDPKRPDEKYTETPTTIAKRKHELDLSQPVSSMGKVEQVIAMNYKILIENVVNGIINGFNQNLDKGRFDGKIPIIMAGGTASPKGFAEYFKNTFGTKTFPFNLSEVVVADKPLFAVAEGCLEAAKLSVNQ